MKWLLLIVTLLTAPAMAHKASDSYLWLEQTAPDAMNGRWDIAVRDLEKLVGLDANADGRITWGELRARAASVEKTVFPTLAIKAGAVCTTTPGALLVDEHAGETYASLAFSTVCPDGLDGLEIDYSLLFDTDTGHRGFLNVSHADRSSTAVLGPDATQWRRAEPGNLTTSGFYDFVREGIWHIWIGYDHIAFLILLLLPSVVRRHDRSWVATENLGAVMVDMARIVTAFTVAHSITLTVAALGIVSLPGKPVEMAIAASVVAAGLHNLSPISLGPRWALAFGFGLVHGFGFASVLSDLGNGRKLVTELLGFNLGVDLGQLAIAFAVLPLIFILRSTTLYRRTLLPAGSLAVAALAGVWFVERTLG